MHRSISQDYELVLTRLRGTAPSDNDKEQPHGSLDRCGGTRGFSGSGIVFIWAILYVGEIDYLLN
jgi:hypothetical protein